MIAKNSQILTEASKTLYQLNADEIMQQRCRAQQDFILCENAMKRQSQEHIAEIKELTVENKELNIKLVALDQEFASAKEAWDTEREQLLARLAEYEAKGTGKT